MDTLSTNSSLFLLIVAAMIIGFIFYVRTYLSLAKHLNRQGGELPEWSVLIMAIPFISILWFLYLLIRLRRHLNEVEPNDAGGMWWLFGLLSAITKAGSYFLTGTSDFVAMSAGAAGLLFFILHWIGLVALKERVGAR